ncbi:MAG: hypothetical protein EA377_05300 [Phycisphaerales bacterium]|nr:MAG: hypothetical protein EA377_05300 [Phycisphaerales bacterium]
MCAIGILRACIVNAFKQHAWISYDHDRQKLVCQLEPTLEGLPIQCDGYSNDAARAAYEGIQADTFDHILAIVPEFGLRVYLNPAGSDLVRLTRIEEAYL